MNIYENDIEFQHKPYIWKLFATISIPFNSVKIDVFIRTNRQIGQSVISQSSCRTVKVVSLRKVSVIPPCNQPLRYLRDFLSPFHLRKLYRNAKHPAWPRIKGYLTDTCLTAQDCFKALLDYFRIKY